MRFALAAVIGIGVVIGLSAPRGPSRAVEPSAGPAAAPTPAGLVETAPARPPITVETPAPVVNYGGETRLLRGPGGHFFADAQVNGAPVHFVVDTGATTVALTMDDARRAGVLFDPGQFTVVGSGASGEVRGQIVQLRDVMLDGKRVSDLPAMVLDGLTVSLLGQNYLSRLDSVAIAGDTMTLK